MTFSVCVSLLSRALIRHTIGIWGWTAGTNISLCSKNHCSETSIFLKTNYFKPGVVCKLPADHRGLKFKSVCFFFVPLGSRVCAFESLSGMSVRLLSLCRSFSVLVLSSFVTGRSTYQWTITVGYNEIQKTQNR